MKTLILLPILLFFSCGSSLYELPPPKPKSEQRTVSLNPTKDAQSSFALFSAAKANVLKLHTLLLEQQFERATTLLSEETLDFLKFGS